MKIGIIGVGNMGEALLSGIVKSEIIKAQDLTVFDKDSAKLQFIENKYGVNIAESNEVLVKESQLLFLTIKPDIYPKLLAEITPYLNKDHVLFSIAPAFNFADMQKLLMNKESKIVLMMSNTAAKIGQALTAACFSNNITEHEKKEIISLFKSFGSFIEADQEQMSTLTSLIGSAPALVYMLIEGLIQGAIQEGISADQAQFLAANIVKSAASMIIQTGEHPAIQRDRICSPSGTTIEGVAYLQNEAFTGKIIEAVHRMAEKARKMQEHKKNY